MKALVSVKLILSAVFLFISAPTYGASEGSRCVPSGEGKCCFEGNTRRQEEDSLTIFNGKFVGTPKETDCSKFTPFDVFELDEMGVSVKKEISVKRVNNQGSDETGIQTNDNSATKKMEKIDAR